MRAAVLLFMLLVASPAFAATHRLAVLVGANHGGDGEGTLRYAETDADKLAHVLVELGGFQPDDVIVLHAPTRAALEQALAAATLRVKTWHAAAASDRVVIIFYYSGHSDGLAFELGTSDRFEYAALRRWLGETGADVRIAIADTCKAGGLIAAKGGKPGPAFDLRLTDDLATRGEALLMSSASNEVALESSEIGGSYFTHHLVSGLRGAADTSGDGVVTLGEAYQYAFTHTLSTTADTTSGPQHPVYDYHLSGQGDLVLTELHKPSAVLALPSGFERTLVADATEVVAEVEADSGKRIALAPGTYTVRVWKDGEALMARVTLDAGEERVVHKEDFARGTVNATLASAKGGPSPPPPSRYELALGVGWSAFLGLYDNLGPEASFDKAYAASVRKAGPSGWSLGVSWTSGTQVGTFYGAYPMAYNVDTTSLALTAGYRLGIGNEALRSWIGADISVGLIEESALEESNSSYLFGIGPTIGIDLHIGGRLWLATEAGITAHLLRERSIGDPNGGNNGTLQYRFLFGMLMGL